MNEEIVTLILEHVYLYLHIYGLQFTPCPLASFRDTCWMYTAWVENSVPWHCSPLSLWITLKLFHYCMFKSHKSSSVKRQTKVEMSLVDHCCCSVSPRLPFFPLKETSWKSLFDWLNFVTLAFMTTKPTNLKDSKSTILHSQKACLLGTSFARTSECFQG